MAIILGIDPGSRHCGYGVINAVGSKLEYMASGVIRVSTLAFPDRLQMIFRDITEIIEEYHPQEAAIEEVFVGKSNVSALKLGQARGAAMVACSNQNLPIHEYGARKVKKALVGSGQADKKQVQHMIMSLLQLAKAPSQDAADALSVAVCHAHTRHTQIRMAGVRTSRRGRMIGN